MSFLLDAKNIQEKMSDAFYQYQAQNSAHMQCQRGCSECCHKRFSVFEWEAYVIVEHFKALSKDDRANVLKKFNMTDEAKCSFLSEGTCTIYEARPSICRTQGATFLVNHVLDVCPLNFVDMELEKNHALDLERINFILSNMQIKFNSLVILQDELKAISRDERVELTELARLLFKIHDLM